MNALVRNYTDSPMRLDLVKILGMHKAVSNVTVNGKAFFKYHYDFLDHVCTSLSLKVKV